MIKTYIFDLDDTLIESTIYKEIYSPIITKIKCKLGISASMLDARARRYGLKKNVQKRWDTGELCKKLGLLSMYYDELNKHIKEFPHLNKGVSSVFLKIKRKGGRIAIASNSMEKTILLFLTKYRLKRYVSFIFSRDDAGCKKDNKIYWKILIQKHRLKPKECLMIGDDLKEDIRIPKSMGFQTFHFAGIGKFKMMPI